MQKMFFGFLRPLDQLFDLTFVLNGVAIECPRISAVQLTPRIRDAFLANEDLERIEFDGFDAELDEKSVKLVRDMLCEKAIWILNSNIDFLSKFAEFFEISELAVAISAFKKCQDNERSSQTKINDFIDGNGAASLHAAAEIGDTRLFFDLMKTMKFDINGKNQEYGGETPLIVAAKFARPEIVAVLVQDKKIKVNLSTTNGVTAFHYACMNGDRDSVTFLVNHGDLNLNSMAIKFAIDYEETGTRKVYRNICPIHLACHFGSERLFEFLTNQKDIKIKVHDDLNRSILHFAFKNRQHEVYKKVLKYPGFNCKHDECQIEGKPIHIVCETNNIIGCKFLLSQPMIELDEPILDRRNTEDFMKTPLLIASSRGFGEITKAILEHGRCDVNFKVDATGETTFLNCCKFGLDEVLEVLMKKKGFTVKKQRFSDGKTPLILAADACSPNSVKQILEFGGFEINAVEKELKRTALMIAAKHGISEICEDLLKVEGIDYNRKDISGMTALHFACRKGDARSVELLLNMPDIDVNARANHVSFCFSNRLEQE